MIEINPRMMKNRFIFFIFIVEIVIIVIIVVIVNIAIIDNFCKIREKKSITF